MEIKKVSKKLFCGAIIDLYEIYDTFDDKKELIGSFELDDDNTNEMHIEHICRSEKYKGYHYLSKVVDWIFKELKPKRLTAMPLSKYRCYYEELGFKREAAYGEDIYYVKERLDEE